MLTEPPQTALGLVPAVGYIRVSKEREGMVSPEIQRHAIETFAARSGYCIVDWIEDLDRSGREFTKRKVGEVIAGLHSGRWKAVLLWKWSRWGRNLKQSMVHLAKVEEAGGVVRAATEDFDTSTPFGRFSRTQFLAMAELDSDLKGEGWKETHARRRRNGLPHTANPRYGYVYSREHGYQPDPDLAPIIEDAYRRFAGGTSMRSLAFEWNQRGLRTVRGNAWEPTSLGRMLDTGFAAGLIREREEPGTAEHNSRTLKTFDIWRPGVHEPIISMTLWDAYRARRIENSEKPRRVVGATHALTGLVYCGICLKDEDLRGGARMVSSYSGRHSRHSWVCRRGRDHQHPSVTASNARLEAVVMTWLEEHAQGGEDMAERLAREQARRTVSTNLENLKSEVARLKSKRKRLGNAYTDGLLDQEDYEEQRADIASALDEVQTAVLLAENEERNLASVQEPTPEGFSALLTAWRDGTGEERHSILVRVVRGIQVDAGAWSDDKAKVLPAWV